MSFVLTADFTIFPDDYPLGPSFPLAGMTFKDTAGPVSFVNETKGVKGLQFGDPGIVIDLPTPTTWAQLLIGQFAKPVTIEAVNSGGVVVNSTTVNKPNSYWFFTLLDSDLKMIRLAGGGNEASIVAVWMLVP